MGKEVFFELERSVDSPTQLQGRFFEIIVGYLDNFIGVSFDPEVGKADVIRISHEQVRKPIDLQGNMFLII